MSGRLTGLRVGRRECLQGQVLDLGLGLVIGTLEPFRLKFLMSGIVSCCEGVLQGETGCGSNRTLRALIRKLLY